MVTKYDGIGMKKNAIMRLFKEYCMMEGRNGQIILFQDIPVSFFEGEEGHCSG